MTMEPIHEVNRNEVSAKYKKHRRGKKHRTAPYCKANEGESRDDDVTSTDKKMERGGGLRPRYSPQAPRNYTQFLIDDNNSVSDSNSSDEDFQSFLTSQFENDFKQARSAVLAQRSHSELQSMVLRLEDKLSSLQERYTSCSECCLKQTVTDDNDNVVSDSNSDSSFTSSDSTETDPSNLEERYKELQEQNRKLLSEQQTLLSHNSECC